MYARRKGWEAQVFADVNSQAEASATHFSRELRIEGNLTEEQRQIADACPLHKLFTGAITVGTKLLEA